MCCSSSLCILCVVFVGQSNTMCCTLIHCSHNVYVCVCVNYFSAGWCHMRAASLLFLQLLNARCNSSEKVSVSVERSGVFSGIPEDKWELLCCAFRGKFGALVILTKIKDQTGGWKSQLKAETVDLCVSVVKRAAGEVTVSASGADVSLFLIIVEIKGRTVMCLISEQQCVNFSCGFNFLNTTKWQNVV